MFPIPATVPLAPLNHFPWELPVGAVCAYAGHAAPGGHPTDPSTAWKGMPCSPSGTSSGNPESDDGCQGEGQPVILEATGWMICDGRELLASEYPELYAALGYLYGGGKGRFNVPDYRGAFLRGVDMGSGVDPDASQRTCPQGGQAASVGSLQCDALQTHTHAYKAVNPAEVMPKPTVKGAGPGTQCAETSAPIQEETVRPSEDNCDGTAIRLSSETRPRNVAVYFIIKYRSTYRGPQVGQPPFPEPPGATGGCG